MQWCRPHCGIFRGALARSRQLESLTIDRLKYTQINLAPNALPKVDIYHKSIITLKSYLDQIQRMEAESRDYPCRESTYGLHKGLRQSIFTSHRLSSLVRISMSFALVRSLWSMKVLEIQSVGLGEFNFSLPEPEHWWPRPRVDTSQYKKILRCPACIECSPYCLTVLKVILVRSPSIYPDEGARI